MPPGTSPGPGPTARGEPRYSAPYGHACATCAKAKCKCIVRSVGSSCERCLRLGRECRPSNGVRKRRNPPPAPPPSSSSARAAQLEEKLDDLVTMLRRQATAAGGDAAGSVADQIGARAAAAAAGVGADPPVILSPESDPGGGHGNGAGRPLGGRRRRVLTPADSHGCGTPTAGSTPAASASSTEEPLSVAQAEETLHLFREHHLKSFPFVFIPPDVTAAQLAAERPYLWLNIRAICSKLPSQRAALGLRCREITAKKVLVDMERNIDLLIGVLAYLGWAMHQFFGKPQLVAMMNIAITLVTDLRLDRPTKDNPNKEENCFKSYVYPRVPISVVRTNEERRATIACYAFCSNVSMFLKSQSMRWTPHMEDSLQKLAANPECPGDDLLVTIVRAHRIIEDVAQVTWRSMDQDGMSSLSPSPRPPPAFYVKALRQNLQIVKDNLPESQVGSNIALSYIYATEMIICDMPFWNNNPWISGTPRRDSSGSGSGHPNTHHHPRPLNLSRLEAYHAALQASRACMDNFLSLPPAAYVGFSFPLVVHFFRSTQVLYRLLLTEDPDWDRAAVAGSVDLMAAIERGAARFARVPGAYGFVSEGEGEGEGEGENEASFVGYTHLDFYTKCARALRSTIPVWDAALAQVGLGRAADSASCLGGRPASGSGSGNGNGSIATAMDVDVDVDVSMRGGVTGMGAGTTGAMEQQLAAGSSVGFAEFMPAAMDFMDDSWWTDILGSWET